MIRKSTVLVGLLLLIAMGAGAQKPAGVGSDRILAYGATPTPWQISIGYQYNLDDVTGGRFHTNGMNVSVERYLRSWVGLEAQVGTGFGNSRGATTPANLDAKSLFVGGGARLAYRGHGRFEPFVHALVGMEKFRFTQTAGSLGRNTAFAEMGGGGVDWPVYPHLAIRAEVDGLGTDFFSAHQGHFQAVGGIVFGF